MRGRGCGFWGGGGCGQIGATSKRLEDSVAGAVSGLRRKFRDHDLVPKLRKHVVENLWRLVG